MLPQVAGAATDSITRNIQHKFGPQVVTAGEVWRQVVADWFDKEVQAGYTYTYIWMANQVGHLFLGFFPVFLLTWFFDSVWKSFPARFPFAIPAALALWWAGKEISDVVRAKRQMTNHRFSTDTSDLWKDAGTAVFFFWSGVLLAGESLFLAALIPLISFVVLLLFAVVGPAWYWLTRKLCFQRAQLPFVTRLADFTADFQNGLIGPGQINAFVENLRGKDNTGLRHILIFGAPNTGRTTLAVAIGTEHAFRVGKSRYVTWTKFLELQHTTEDPKKVWPWNTVDILILDDVCVDSGATPAEVMRDVANQIRSLGSTTNILKRLHVVWVLGPVLSGRSSPDAWQEMFATCLDLSKSDIGIAELVGNHEYGRPTVPVSSLSGH
jgi:hypothetical protein